MLKYTFETKKQELKTWVDPNTGALSIQIGKETVSLPTEIGLELIAVLRQKQEIYKDVERKRVSSWNRFMDSLNSEPENTSNHTSEKKSFKAA